ncbi:hypothetical protein SAMN03159341_1248 [Paenibacillus sp. 1_12]|nr:hypothetical protein SAMN03159341_1248 [Paenibacillus sp. 1_12]
MNQAAMLGSFFNNSAYQLLQKHRICAFLSNNHILKYIFRL